ncbi:MAG: MotA/TolQ/ExbB proton channel family protein [Clostridia bacterium]|jgi:hypothetical protein|nr:MotA/TolQ/ExbB proton channel family protein [Clostridia bacterium]
MYLWQRITGWLGSGISAVVYAAIIALFFIGVFSCILPVSNNRKRLKRAIASIKQGDKAKRSWQEDRFLGRGSLMPHWSEYLNNLFFADGEYHNPANVEDYINEETVIDGPGRAKLSEALPGVQVSLGFLGTLLGLSLALSEMNSVNAATITSSMNTLLSSMKYAFLTSIFGVVASISFTLITRAVHSKAQNTLIEFYNAMAKYAGVLSVDPMTQVAIYQQEQTGLLRQLTEALKPERMEALFRPVADAANLQSEKQREMMDQVAQAYIDRLDQAFHGQLEALSNTIRDTCAYQEKTVKTVSDALSDFAICARSIHDMQSDCFALLEKYDKLLRRTQTSVEEFSELAQQDRALLSSQTECIDSLHDLAEKLKKETDDMTQAAEGFLLAASRLEGTAAKTLEGAGKALSDTASGLAGQVNEARQKLDRDMDESLAYFEGCMTQVMKHVEKAARQVEKAASALPAGKKSAGGDA